MRIARSIAALALLAASASCFAQKDGDAVIVAGTGAVGFSGDGAAATSATLNGPSGLSFDAAGNLYIADYGNHRVRRVDTKGIITTVAGTEPVNPSTGSYSGDNGAATSAGLSFPIAVRALAGGGFLIADNGNNRVRQVDASGTITTLAGNGSTDFNGDDQAAVNATLDFPADMLTLGDSVLIADFSHNRVRQVKAGIISTFAGSGFVAHDGDGGPATLASIGSPWGLATDSQGAVYITDFVNHLIRKVGADGTIGPFAGLGDKGFSGDGGNAVDAALYEPALVAVAPDGGIVFADSGNNRIRKVDAQGKISTIAGTGTIDPYVSSSDPKALNLSGPTGVAVSPSGETYFTDNGHGLVYRIVGASAPARLPGDINGNGRVDVADAVMGLKAVAGLITLDAAQAQAADVYPKPGTGGRPFGDGKVTIPDILRILKRVAGLEPGSTWPA
ncbi:MAG TPA: hypothetical protein VGN26_17685 [Armatimonadota bacterium]|jgi:hypothetical protein